MPLRNEVKRVHPHPNPPPSPASLREAGRARGRVYLNFTVKYFPSILLQIFFILLFFSLISKESFASEYMRVEGAIHLDTNIGGGIFMPEEIVKKVRDAGIRIAIITDHDNMRVEYGIPLLRKIIKKSVDKGGIKKYGSKRYIETIESLKVKYPDTLILHGTESVPFY